MSPASPAALTPVTKHARREYICGIYMHILTLSTSSGAEYICNGRVSVCLSVPSTDSSRSPGADRYIPAKIDACWINIIFKIV